MSQFRKIGVLSSGGDAPGMNAAIRAITRKALSRGVEVMGIYGGYKGLINGDIQPLTTHSVSNIVTRGGTILYSSRCPEFKTESGMKKALENCKKNNIDAVIALGGDGTFRGATDLTAHGIPSVGIPCTIDNDIPATEYTIGFDTSLNTILSMIDYLRDTAESHARCIVVEVMGNHCGDLALYSAIASGAVSVAIPEIKFDEEKAVARIQKARDNGKRGLIAVVSEGVLNVGNLKYSEYFAGKISAETNIETKFARCGHIVRGGNPTLRDRVIATQMGTAAVDAILDNKSNLVITYNDGQVSYCDIQYALTLDKVYKNQLSESELAAMDPEILKKAKETCEARTETRKKLYQMAYDVCQ